MALKNEEMIRYLVESGYVNDRIANAMRKIPREYFIPVRYKEHAYVDNPLPIGHGQTISAPSIVGLMTKELDVKEGMKILEIGSGSGWQAALICELVGKEGKVYTVERIPELVAKAKKNIEEFNYENILFLLGDGTRGYPDFAPYDRIIVTAAAPEIPKPLIDQLKEGGKMIIPVGSMFWQNLIKVEKNKSVKETNLLPVMFVPLVGEYGYPER